MSNLLKRCGFVLGFIASLQLPAFGSSDLQRISTRAHNLLCTGQYQSAIQTLNTGIAQHPKVAELYSARASCYSVLGKHAEALKDINRAIGLEPRNALYYGNRASLLFANGKIEQAILDYDKAIKMKPEWAPGRYYSRGNAILALKGKDSGDLLPDFNNALKISANYYSINAAMSRGDYFNSYLFRAKYHHFKVNYKAAISDYKSALSLEPKSAEALVGLGFCCLHEKNYESALSSFTRAIDIAPKTSNYAQLAFAGRAEASLALSHVDIAKVDVDRCDVAHPQTSYVSARLMNAAGDKDAALEQYPRFVAAARSMLLKNERSHNWYDIELEERIKTATSEIELNGEKK
ncbi:MAG: tetratricopeptide repeat protein [Leptolyngbya sp.]|nr:tetratricopeptide repeat protein [Candidatus Melainabacteria bacterium]